MVLLRKRSLVGFIEPCLPSAAKAPPIGAGWIHEIKHDGFRIMARRDGAGVRLITRNGNDFTKRFPLAAAAVTALIPALSCQSCRPNAPFAEWVCLSKASLAQECYAERSGNRWVSE
jgi:ATP-dependent DNA ligase